MNRKQRRAQRKPARNATPEEIFPGQHGPVQNSLAELMPDLVRIIQDELGSNFTVTLFVAEVEPPATEKRLPRFNYVSSANREDMREAFLSLTSAGRAMYEELAPHALDFARRLTDILTPQDREAFNRAVQQITARSAELAAEVAQEGKDEN